MAGTRRQTQKRAHRSSIVIFMRTMDGILPGRCKP
jgi:hypothetical protein